MATEKSITSTQVREQAIRQCDNAAKLATRLESVVTDLHTSIISARTALANGVLAGSIPSAGGSDLDLIASQLSRRLERIQALIMVAYDAEEGAGIGLSF